MEFFSLHVADTLPLRVLHHSKELWGDNADDWSPERWLVEDTAALDKNWIPVSYPFSHEFESVNQKLMKHHSLELDSTPARVSTLPVCNCPRSAQP